MLRMGVLAFSSSYLGLSVLDLSFPFWPEKFHQAGLLLRCYVELLPSYCEVG